MKRTGKRLLAMTRVWCPGALASVFLCYSIVAGRYKLRVHE